MQITTALSTEIDIEDACREAASEALESANGAEIDLCLLFVSGAYGSKITVAPSLMTELVDPTRLVGCAAGGIIGNGVEIEGMPAVSVSLLSLPNAEVEIVYLIEQDLPNDDLGQDEWVRLLMTPPAEATGFILLPDPFSFPTDRLLGGLDFAYPGVSKIGGLISGSAHPGGNVLFVDQTVYHEGAVAMVFSGNIVIETVVAQGCKPFGKIGRLTKIKDNQILSIDGMSAMQFLLDQLEDLSGEDLNLARSTPLFLGIAMDPFATTEPAHGDYLIRNMIGYDPESGSLAIGAEIGLGRQVQFHLRDGRCSSNDLEAVLEQGIRDGRLSDPGTRGALLFSCLGRGEHLYGRPNHDSEMFRSVVGHIPLSGFFCNGEIGPVQGSTYIHGYTSAFGVLREKES
jgi:small ligand-binding sensory domain FIST